MTTTHEPIGRRRAPALSTPVTTTEADRREWFLIRFRSPTAHTARQASHGSPRTLCGQIILPAQRKPAGPDAPRCKACSRVVTGGPW